MTNADRTTAEGALRFSRTVETSTTSVEAKSEIFVPWARRRPRSGSFEAARRSRLYFTAAASSGVPSWNVTPFFSRSVHVLPSLLVSMLSAIRGSNSLLALNFSRES